MEKQLQYIKDYYERAWKAIVEKDFKTATKVLYREMSMKLYDMSLNIEYLQLEKKPNFTEEEARLFVIKEELQHLIKKVSTALKEESGVTDEEAIDGEDMSETELLKLEEQEKVDIEDDSLDAGILDDNYKEY